MDLNGRWEVTEVFTGFDDDFNMVFKPKDEVLAMEDNDETKDLKIMARVVVEIDGLELKMLYNLDDDQIEMAKEEGLKQYDGNLFLAETSKLVKKDGKYYIKSGSGSDQLLDELQVNDEGIMNFISFRLKRM